METRTKGIQVGRSRDEYRQVQSRVDAKTYNKLLTEARQAGISLYKVIARILQAHTYNQRSKNAKVDIE